VDVVCHLKWMICAASLIAVKKVNLNSVQGTYVRLNYVRRCVMKRYPIRMVQTIFILICTLYTAQTSCTSPTSSASEQHLITEIPSAPPAEQEHYLITEKPSAPPADGSEILSDADSAEFKEEVEQQVQKNGGVLSFDTLFEIWGKASNLASKGRDVASKGTAQGAQLLSLLPKSLLNSLIQKELGIKQVSIGKGPSGFKNSFTITGTDSIGKAQGFVTLLYAPVVPGAKRGGNSLSFGIPKDTPIDNIIPGINTQALGKVPIADLRIILSDFDYTDPTNNYPIVKGLNFMVGIDPSQMGIFDWDKLKKILQIEGGVILGIATITKTPEEEATSKIPVKTSFKVIIPPHAIKITKFKLSELTDLLNVPLPDKVETAFSKATIDELNISVDFTPNNQKFELSGVTDNIFGAHSVNVAYKIFKAEKSDEESSTVWVNTLSLAMPEGWKIAQTIPELKVLSPLIITNQTLNVISRSSATTKAGVDYTGTVDIKSFGSNPIIKSLGTVLGQQMTVFGSLTTNLSDSQFSVNFGKNRPKEVKLSLGDFIPSKFGKVKSELSKGSFSLGEFNMMFGGKNATQSMRVTGTTAIANAQAKTEIRMAYIGSEWKGDLVLSIPQKVQGISPVVDEVVSDLPFTSLVLGLIQVPYVDPVTGIDFEEGLNIGGYLGFTGKMSFVEKVFHIKGLNISGVIGMMSIDNPTQNIKLEASLPGNQELNLGHNVKMNKLKVYMAMGTAPSVGIEGAVLIPVPKGYRPKHGTPSTATRVGALNLNNRLYIPIIENLTTACTSSDIATSADVPEEVASTDQSLAAGDTGDIVITEENVDTTPPPNVLEEGEIASLVDENAEQTFTDTEMDMSDFGAPLPDNSELTINGSLAVSGEAGMLSCAMDGAIDLKGLVLENVGFDAQVTMTAPPVPTGLGFRADMQLTSGKNPKIIKFAAKMALGTTTTSIAWLGSYDGGLYFSDLVDVAFNVAKHGPGVTQQYRQEFFNAMKKVPKFGIKNISMAIVPFPTTIAGKTYEEGTSADIKFVLFGANGQAAVKIDYDGMSGTGWLDKVALPRSKPQFILSSYNGDTGPSVSFSIGKSKKLLKLGNEFIVDGNIEIKPIGIKSATSIKVSGTEGAFKTIDKVYGLYETELEVTLALSHIDKARVKGTFKQAALSKFSSILRDAAVEVVNLSKKELDKARNDIIKEFDGKIASARETVRKEREKATSSISGANKNAQAKMDAELKSIQTKLDRAKKKLNDDKKKCKKVDLAACARVVGDGVEVGALEAAKGSVHDVGKKTVQGTLDVAKGTVNLAPIDSDPRVSSMIVAKETALAGIQAGKFGAKSIGELSNGLATAAEKTLNVSLVQFDVYMGDLLKGKLPKFSMEGIILGKKIRVKDLQLDLKNPASIKKLAQSIVHSL